MTRPLAVSVITAVCDPPVDALEECLRSVATQHVTGGFEHVIVDDASTDPAVIARLDTAAHDSHVRLERRAGRGGIVAASNDALALAQGDVVVLVDHDDVLAANALAVMAEQFADETCDLAYSDHDLIRPDGRLADPFYKPDFSPERLRHQNYITHLVAIRRSLVVEVGGFRSGFDGAQDHDLLLRVSERARRVVHVPQVLLHWRQHARSVSLDPLAKADAYERGRVAVEQHCARVGIEADGELGPAPGTYRVVRPAAAGTTSIVVAAPGGAGSVWGAHGIHLERLLASVTQLSSTQLIVAVPPGVDPGDLVGRGIDADTVIADDTDALWRDGVRRADGDTVVFLTESMFADDRADDPIGGVVGHLADPDVIAAGGLQLRTDDTIAHAGFVTGDHAAVGILTGWSARHSGPGRLLEVAREVRAVDVVGAALRRRDAQTLGDGPDATLTARGIEWMAGRPASQRVIWTPQSRWFRLDAPSEQLPATGGRDPFYNPNLQPGRGDWLERPGRAGAAPYERDPSGQILWA